MIAYPNIGNVISFIIYVMINDFRPAVNPSRNAAKADMKSAWRA